MNTYIIKEFPLYINVYCIIENENKPINNMSSFFT